MFEESVGRVIGAERSAHGGDRDLRFAIVPDEGHDFLAKVGIENRLNVAAMKRVRFLVVKAEAIDGINCKEFDAASMYKIGKRSDHALAFEFPLVTGTGGKTKERRTPVAVHDDAELDAQPGRVPAMVFALHCEVPSEPRESSMAAGAPRGQLICAVKSKTHIVV